MSAALTTNVDQKLLRSTKFPPEFEQRVDMSKVQLTVIKKWVADEVERILKTEDEIVTEMIFEILDSKVSPNIKSLQISLGGFMDKDAAPFCLRLWQMCLSAQQNAQGIPQQLLEAKKAELREEAQAREVRLARRREEEEMEAQRERERHDRARDSGRGGRGGRDHDHRPRPRDYSRSPPPRRRERDDDSYYRAPRTIDSYIPAGSRRNDRPSPPPPRHNRNRSPSSSGRSRSRSPPRRRRSPSPDRASRSRSRTPPSRRYRARSRSPRRRRNDRRGGNHTRSQHYRPGSRSPRRDDSHSRTRSPPRKRRRSPSRSKTPPKKRGSLAENDLLASTTTADKHRLSRDPSIERKGGGGVEDEV